MRLNVPKSMLTSPSEEIFIGLFTLSKKIFKAVLYFLFSLNHAEWNNEFEIFSEATTT